MIRRSLPAVMVCFAVLGCSSSPQQAASSDPPAKLRLQSILKFYQMCSNEKKKPPSDEKAFKEYIRGLPQSEKDAAGVGADVDGFLTSPRDGQKYHIEYGAMARPGGQNQALAWEETGKGGSRFVALTMGYVQEYNEQMFQDFRKKK